MSIKDRIEETKKCLEMTSFERLNYFDWPVSKKFLDGQLQMLLSMQYYLDTNTN